MSPAKLQAVDLTPEPHVSRMTITPHVAEGWLEKNTRNRKVHAEVVMKYAEDIRHGRWLLNGESIVISSDGMVIDGQHRLLAILEAHREIESFVAIGVDPAAFETIDQGRSRSPADVLSILGYQDTNNLAALARQTVHWKRHHTLNARANELTAVSTQEIVKEVNENSGALMDSIRAVKGARALFGGATALAFCWLLFAEIDLSDRDLFFDRLTDGQALLIGDPIYALRAALFSVRQRHRQMPRAHICALVTKAWNKYRLHETINTLVFRADEAWPMPE